MFEQRFTAVTKSLRRVFQHRRDEHPEYSRMSRSAPLATARRLHPEKLTAHFLIVARRPKFIVKVNLTETFSRLMGCSADMGSANTSDALAERSSSARSFFIHAALAQCSQTAVQRNSADFIIRPLQDAPLKSWCANNLQKLR